jgi:hypothetical protein
VRGGDAVLLQHYREQLGVDDRAGVEKLHADTLAATARINTDLRKCQAVGRDASFRQ